MKVYIFADMEGISGISSKDFVTRDGCRYLKGCEYMVADINACIRGCFKGGADGVIVRDGHSSGVNIHWDQIDPRAELIQGNGGKNRIPALEDCGALILLGYHAMAGAAPAVLEHTYTSARNQNVWLNGDKVGEFAIDAAIAGESGVPVIMVSGDDRICEEARALIHDVVVCQVKTALACQEARMLSPAEAHRRLEESAEKAVRLAGVIKPYVVPGPVTIRVELVERGTVPNPTGRPGTTILDGRTYEVTADCVESALFLAF